MSGHAEALFQIFLAFTAARLLGHLFQRFKLPAVVGELLAGALLGPYLLNVLHPGEVLDAFAELGVIMLLFMAGLETHIRELSAVRAVAFKVAILGALLPFALGLAGGWAFSYHLYENLFVATALMATSVGITIRVLQELGYQQRKSVRIILAAAVIDDVLGLLVLGVVTVVALGQSSALALGLLFVEAGAYVVAVLLIGPRLMARASSWLSRFKVDLLFEIGIVIMLALSLLADYIGLAAIVGAFLAGLTVAELKQHTAIEERFEPLAWFFVPFFFVLIGSYLDFGSFAKPAVLLQIAVFTAVAMASKYFGAVWGAHGEDRRIVHEVGVGMIPRGEVGLVVAGIALASGVLDDGVYAAMIGMVLLTTLASPFLIKAVYARTRTDAGDRPARPPGSS